MYHEFAGKEQLFVAVVHEGEKLVYAGHLLFDSRPPKASIRQIFVLERYRRLNVGAKLVDELKTHLTELQFIAIHARVGEDMSQANAFWERQSFYPQRIAPGGASRKRIIVVRSHELSTPQLFAASGIDNANPFGLNFAAQNETPVFLLDLNVLFDLGQRRARHDDVLAVFRAERMQACDLAISSEIRAELLRTAPSGKTDPMLDFTSILPTFNAPDSTAWDRLAEDLGPIVFPERAKAGSLTVNDLSDLRHLATAIFHGLHGLVTSDSSVLAAAAPLRERFGIEALSPDAFTLDEEMKLGPGSHSVAPGAILIIQPMTDADEVEVRALLTSLSVGRAAQASEWAAVDGNRRACHRYVVRTGAKLVGYTVWPNVIPGSFISAMMAVDEGTPAAADSARLMLAQLTEQVASSDVLRIRLNFPARQVVVREVAVALGFTGSGEVHSQLQKIAINGVVTTANWRTRRDALVTACEVRMPAEPPAFRNVDQQIELYGADGNRTHQSLLKLESILSPALFCLPGRTGVLVPLRREYSEPLLNHLTQGSLLPQARAQLYQQRNYLSHPKTLAVFTRGSLIFFYESSKGKGLGAVVAVARVVRAYHRDMEAMGNADLDASVFEAIQLAEIGKSDIRTVTVFDNVTIFPKTVSRDVLQRIGCGTPTQLLTSRRISSEQVQGILSEAYS
ncbi:MAG: GNAT family N-acetyltransferase [Burkholderiales bacterium]